MARSFFAKVQLAHDDWLTINRFRAKLGLDGERGCDPFGLGNVVFRVKEQHRGFKQICAVRDWKYVLDQSGRVEYGTSECFL